MFFLTANAPELADFLKVTVFIKTQPLIPHLLHLLLSLKFFSVEAVAEHGFGRDESIPAVGNLYVKMKVRGGGKACHARQSNGLALPYTIPKLYQGSFMLKMNVLGKQPALRVVNGEVVAFVVFKPFLTGSVFFIVVYNAYHIAVIGTANGITHTKIKIYSIAAVSIVMAKGAFISLDYVVSAILWKGQGQRLLFDFLIRISVVDDIEDLTFGIKAGVSYRYQSILHFRKYHVTEMLLKVRV